MANNPIDIINIKISNKLIFDMQACVAGYLNYQVWVNLLENVNLQQKKNAIGNAFCSVKPWENLFIIISLN